MPVIDLTVGENGTLFREGIYVGQFTNTRRMPLPTHGQLQVVWKDDSAPTKAGQPAVELPLLHLLASAQGAVSSAHADLCGWRALLESQRRAGIRSDLVPHRDAMAQTDRTLTMLSNVSRELTNAADAYAVNWPIERRMWETADGQVWSDSERAIQHQRKLNKEAKSANAKGDKP